MTTEDRSGATSIETVLWTDGLLLAVRVGDKVIEPVRDRELIGLRVVDAIAWERKNCG